MAQGVRVETEASAWVQTPIRGLMRYFLEIMHPDYSDYEGETQIGPAWRTPKSDLGPSGFHKIACCGWSSVSSESRRQVAAPAQTRLAESAAFRCSLPVLPRNAAAQKSDERQERA